MGTTVEESIRIFQEAEHQERERAVPCIKCHRRMTWNHDAICGICRED